MLFCYKEHPHAYLYIWFSFLEIDSLELYSWKWEHCVKKNTLVFKPVDVIFPVYNVISNISLFTFITTLSELHITM